jgi:hypothetical protein
MAPGAPSVGLGPPCALYLRTVAKVMSREELASEVANCKGQNDEGIDIRPQSQVLHASLPRSLPYAIIMPGRAQVTSSATGCDRWKDKMRPRWPISAGVVTS